jgi:hypothetical protein
LRFVNPKVQKIYFSKETGILEHIKNGDKSNTVNSNKEKLIQDDKNPVSQIEPINLVDLFVPLNWNHKGIDFIFVVKSIKRVYIFQTKYKFELLYQWRYFFKQTKEYSEFKQGCEKIGYSVHYVFNYLLAEERDQNSQISQNQLEKVLAQYKLIPENLYLFDATQLGALDFYKGKSSHHFKDEAE